MAERRALLHPLAGCTPATLWATLLAHGGIAPRHAAQFTLTALTSLIRLPRFALEAARFKDAIAGPDISPVFVVGHWRSGTTYLHNLLSRDKRFAFPGIADVLRPHDLGPGLTEPIWRRILLASLPPTRPMDDVPLRADLPQEEEIAFALMGAPSLFNCFYFPRQLSATFAREVLLEDGEEGAGKLQQAYRVFLGKLAALNPGRRLVLKNPASSARIALLSEWFPGAKFIHITRDPGEVFASTLRLYRRMIETVGLQDSDDAELEEHVLWAYPEVMERLLRDLARLPASSVARVRYDALIARPLEVVEQIYGDLQLGSFAEARHAMAPFLNEPYQPARPTVLSSAQRILLTERWGTIAHRLGYRI